MICNGNTSDIRFHLEATHQVNYNLDVASHQRIPIKLLGDNTSTFPSISGGKVMTVTPAGGASRPSVTPAKTFTGVTLTGPSVSTDGGT